MNHLITAWDGLVAFWNDLPPLLRLILAGLATAAVNGGAAALGFTQLDPAHFNRHELRHVGGIFGAGAIVGVINWLRQSPWKRGTVTAVVDKAAASIP